MKAKTGRGLRKMVIWLNRLSAVTIAVCIVFMMASSVISPAENNRTYTYYKTPIERGQVAFEDTALFTEILKEELKDITRMCVIRNQMETDGKYNGEKVIDITAFANRDDSHGTRPRGVCGCGNHYGKTLRQHLARNVGDVNELPN